MNLPFGDQLASLLRSAYEELEESAAQGSPEPNVIVTTPEIQKLAAYIQTFPLPSRRLRLRWWWQARWSRLRLRVGSWIAGVDLDGDE